MKKPLLSVLIICIIYAAPLNAQVGKLLNKVSKSVAGSVAGKPESANKNSNTEPEPKCACEKPELILDLGGNLKLNYSEISLTMRDDGALLLKDRISGDYYIAKDGTTQGPVKAGDKRLTGFPGLSSDDAPERTSRWADNEYISSAGEKFLIKFKGKSYGPYGEIKEFKVTRSKDKFAAIVSENVPMSEAEAKKMNDAIKNAKTDQEKMDLAMQYSQQMMQKMQAGGGPTSILPKLVTNIPGITYDPLKSAGGTLNNDIKFDDIFFKTYDKVIDLSNKILINIKPEAQNSESLFLNTDNTIYASYVYGNLNFSDGTSLSELFNPRPVQVNGRNYLAYLYFSPQRNSIMQCKIPF